MMVLYFQTYCNQFIFSHLFFNILGLVACGNSSNAWQINESQIRYIGGTDFQVNHLMADAFPLTSESILSCKTRNSSRNDPNSDLMYS